ncbi:hypothetical protein GCM10010169_08400 [Micromonospora fulviviridis]|uniref:hypothetical protein n=1 Tax=Micromonospora fulviviridis TaxID=47860 RepID=UPI0019966433|nr:hypothetical protein [Micromonospora fulviviridis]GGR67077.1 hypothetical protein GCM10010169_08400 [Micromonospora fulviviridis]
MSESGATRREPDPASERLAHRGGGGSEPDVLLDIPEVTVDQIRLSVEGLDADLSLRARLANLLQLDAGVRVHLEGVELDMTGVSAEALLKVRLEKLVQILDRALSTIDRNPHLIDVLARSVGGGIDDVNRAAQQLASAPVVDESGQRIGTVGAVADRALREGVGRPAPPSPAPPAGARSPQPPTGAQGPPTGAQGPPTGPAGRPPSTDRGAGQAPAGPGTPTVSGKTSEPGRPAGSGKPPEPASSGKPSEPEKPTGSGKPSEPGKPAAAGKPAEAEKAPGGQPGPAQLAGQAGETLLQAGRSVWEAIQSGMGQHRPKR